MKMTFKTIAVGLLLTAFFNHYCIAQSIASKSANDMAVEKIDLGLVNYSAANNKATTDIARPNNTQLTEKFTAMFPAAQNQQWANTTKGYWVSFNDNNRKKRAGFNDKGETNYIITECAMDQLELEFRNYISKKYSGYTLVNAIEINTLGKQIQQAILENNSTFVTLKFTEDGVEEHEKIIKAR